MRTTVEITDLQRARLLAIAAERGETGFSRLVQEALDLYLSSIDSQDREVREALKTIGSLTDKSAARMRDSVAEIRARWR